MLYSYRLLNVKIDQYPAIIFQAYQSLQPSTPVSDKDQTNEATDHHK